MKKLSILWLWLLGAALVARADEPATTFFVLETPALKRLTERRTLDAVPSEELEAAAIVSGVVARAGYINVQTATMRINVTLGLNSDWSLASGELCQFAVSLTALPERKIIVSLLGEAVLEGRQRINKNWRDEKHAAVFRFVNLKK